MLLATTLMAAFAVLSDAGAEPRSLQATLVAQAEQHSFDIPAQPLATALNAFGRQAGLQVTLATDVSDGIQSQAVHGTFTPEEALRRLLAGTAITWRFTGEGTVLLERTSSEGALTLDPVTVEARGETAWSAVEGYAATRSATATKTDTPILEVPASVQVVPRQAIEDQGALNLKDVYGNVSSVQQAGNTLNAQSEVLPIIRGFESPTLLRNGLRSSVVGAVDLVNVERVEVLKGPASILYGALEPGGIVNYVTKRPQRPARHVIGAQLGSYNFVRATVDSTASVTEDDSLLYRFNFARTDSGSFRDDMELERTAVAPSVLWAPTDQTELLLDFSYLREQQPYDTGIPLAADGSPLVPIDTFFNDPDLEGRTIKDYTASYQLTHRFNEVWSLRNQFQFHRAEAKNESIRPRAVVDVPGGAVLALRYQNEDRRDDELQFVVDTTANFATGPVDHTLLLGTELISQDSDFRRFRQNIAPVPVTADVEVDFTPPANQPQQVILGETQWAGIYVQDQLSLLEDGRLKLLLGGRYDVVHQESETDGVAAEDVDDQALSGRAGLLYQLTDHYSGYVSVSQSFLPQATGTLDASGTPLDPEEGLQYEVGVKASFFDDRLLATASVFQIDKENVAVVDQELFNATGQIAYFPGVEQRSRGFELDLAGALTDEIDILANYSFTATEVLENANDPETVGDPLGGVPRHKARLWMTYHFGEGSALSGFGFGGGLRFVGKSTAQFDTDIKLDPYVVFDAGAWYSWEMLKFGLNVTNLLDKEYIVRASDRAIAHPGEPFTVIGSLSISF